MLHAEGIMIGTMASRCCKTHLSVMAVPSGVVKRRNCGQQVSCSSPVSRLIHARAAQESEGGASDLIGEDAAVFSLEAQTKDQWTRFFIVLGTVMGVLVRDAILNLFEMQMIIQSCVVCRNISLLLIGVCAMLNRYACICSQQPVTLFSVLLSHAAMSCCNSSFLGGKCCLHLPC